MADRRKLQGEVDRCLKKVSEGVEAFDDIWQKVQNATNVNQKEKYEGELKREIKKLQRLREQIKTWVASSDIKDKKTLLENRRLIEQQMEKFRVVEKETKTKAFSKEGLGQAKKVDPETKEFVRCREWLNDAIQKLNLQIDQMEMEQESLHAGMKKKKPDKDKAERLAELTDRIEKHRYHISQLEHVLRMLDNESLEVDMVNKVKDDVDYYIENCQEPDFLDDEGIYDDLDLDHEGDLEGSMKLDDKCEDDEIQSSPGSSLNSGYSCLTTSSPASKSNNNSPRKNSKNSTSSNTSLINGVASSSTTTTTVSSSSSSTPSKRNLFSSSHNNTSSVSTDSNTTEPISSVPMVNGLDHKTNAENTTTSSVSETKESNVPIAPYASAAAPETSSTNPGPSSPKLTSAEETAVQVVRNHVESLKYTGLNTSNPHWRSTASAITSDTNPTTPTVTSSSNTQTTTSDSSNLNNDDVMTSSQEAGPSLLGSVSRSLSTTTAPQIQTSSQSIISYPSVSSVSQKIDEQLQPPTDFSLKTNSLFGGVINPSTLPQKPPNSDTQEVRLQPVHGVAPLGPVLLTQERLYQLKMLDAAYHHLPQRQDGEKMRPYISRSAVPIASYHHHQPPPSIDTVEFFQRLSTETLFFIFYYQEGTRAQYLAAKALKKQSWRFHTKYMMWFQRHEEPKRITDEFEEGTYIFFDYEKWSQRKRDGFTFEYRFLEDKDLP